MSLGKLQPTEGLKAKLLNVQAITLQLTISFGGSWICCRNATASGHSMIVRNGCAWRPAFLTLAIRRVMANTERSLLRW